jgi:hypothetical protein
MNKILLYTLGAAAVIVTVYLTVNWDDGCLYEGLRVLCNE